MKRGALLLAVAALAATAVAASRRCEDPTAARCEAACRAALGVGGERRGEVCLCRP